jgi:hypothetical protein
MVRLFVALFLIFPLIFPVSVFAEIVGSFTLVKPKVSLIRAGKELIPCEGHSVAIGDLITTGEEARARILFKDDSILTLAQNTKLEIKEYLIEKDKRNSIISLQAGKLRTEVTKFLTPESKFEVHTPTAIAGARGSDWLSVVESNPKTTIYCLHGSISIVNPEFPTQILTLTVGQYAVVEAGMAPTFLGTFKPEMIKPIMDEMVIITPEGGARGAAGATAAGEAAGATTILGVTGGTLAAAAAMTAVAIFGIITLTGGSDGGGKSHHAPPAHQ